MESNHLLSSGIEMLNEIKGQLLDLQGYQAKSQNLRREEEKLDKNVQALEKTISDEIATTVKKRKSEIEETFDEQLSNIRSRVKKLKDKRDKRKSQKVSKRILEETTYLSEANTKLKREIKTLCKQNSIPQLWNNKLYYALYFPKTFGDFIIILAVLILTLLIIPCGIYIFLLPEEKSLYLIIIYFFTAVIFMGIYLFIGRTKEKYSEGWKQINAHRGKRRENTKQIKSIKKSIKKDRDESSYGLEDFDVELERLNKEEENILAHKEEALSVFDNTTSPVIAGEIRNRNEEIVSKIKGEQKQALEEWSSTQENIKALTLKIANEYEAFLGKDLMTVERIESLSNIIKEGNAATISEAAVFFRQKTNQK